MKLCPVSYISTKPSCLVCSPRLKSAALPCGAQNLVLKKQNVDPERWFSQTTSVKCGLSWARPTSPTKVFSSRLSGPKVSVLPLRPFYKMPKRSEASSAFTAMYPSGGHAKRTKQTPASASTSTRCAHGAAPDYLNRQHTTHPHFKRCRSASTLRRGSIVQRALQAPAMSTAQWRASIGWGSILTTPSCATGFRRRSSSFTRKELPILLAI